MVAIIDGYRPCDVMSLTNGITGALVEYSGNTRSQLHLEGERGVQRLQESHLFLNADGDPRISTNIGTSDADINFSIGEMLGSNSSDQSQLLAARMERGVRALSGAYTDRCIPLHILIMPGLAPELLVEKVFPDSKGYRLDIQGIQSSDYEGKPLDYRILNAKYHLVRGLMVPR